MSDKAVGTEAEIIIKVHKKTYKTYHWHCPGCERRLEAGRHPGHVYEDLLCSECCTAWDARQFDAHFAPVIGATVRAVGKPSEAFDETDVLQLELVDNRGRVWLVTSDTVIYVYRDKRTPGVQSEDKR